jgi:LysM domain
MRTKARQQNAPIRRGIRVVLVVVAAVATTAVLVDWGRAAWHDLRTLGSSSVAPADAIADVAAVLALVAWVWLLVGAMVTVVEATTRSPGQRIASRIAPASWRRLVLSAVGIGLLGAPVGVAHASPGDGIHVMSATGPDPGSAATPAEVVRGLPLPDRPFGRLAAGGIADVEQDLGGSSRPPARVTVRPGDSLWAIAERHLGSGADIQAVATEWRRWYAANQSRIGPDPNLIHPGTVLHAPLGEAAS